MIAGNYCSNPNCTHGYATVNGVLMTECRYLAKQEEIE